MKYLIAIIFVFLLVLLLFGSSVFSSFSIISDLFSSPGFDARDVLLKQTDFPELLKAVRELISKAEWQEYVNNYDGKKERRLIIPKDINEPEYIQIFGKMFSGIKGLGWNISMSNTGCLVLFFYGERETGHFGIRVFPEDVNESANKFTGQDDIMIMPGMWYFDDVYHEFPKLREENLSNIKKNKSLENK
jgi:hypothetical protein